MATKRPARASPELREAPLSPRYHPELHHPMGHCLLCGLGDGFSGADEILEG